MGRIDRLLKGRAATAAKAIAKRALTASGAMGLALRARRSNPMILMYHGVTAQPAGGLRNTEGKHVGVDRFAAQLRFLARYRRVLSLTDFVDGVLAGRDMRDAVTLTFDDGYENNVTCAAPVLSDCKLPASFFLASVTDLPPVPPLVTVGILVGLLPAVLAPPLPVAGAPAGAPDAADRVEVPA